MEKSARLMSMKVGFQLPKSRAGVAVIHRTQEAGTASLGQAGQLDSMELLDSGLSN